jgi:NitT/TauT family transport system substrate-binding protein
MADTMRQISKQRFQCGQFFGRAGVLLLRALLPLALATQATQETSAQDKKIVIGYVERDLNNLPPLVAEAKGYFRDAGFSTQVVQVRTAVSTAALLSGALDYHTSFASTIQRAMQGVPLRGLLTMVERPNFYLVSRPEIRTVADLRGKAIGVGSVGSINAIITQQVLAHFGVPIDTVTIMAAGDFQTRMAALKSGTIQAAMAVPPAPVQVKAWGFNVLAFTGDYVDLPLAGLSTTVNKLKMARSEVVAVIIPILRALQVMKSNRAEAVTFIQKFLRMEKPLAEAAYDLSVKSYSATGSVSAKGIQNIMDMAPPGTNRQVQVADVADFGPLKEAQAALGIR